MFLKFLWVRQTGCVILLLCAETIARGQINDIKHLQISGTFDLKEPAWDQENQQPVAIGSMATKAGDQIPFIYDQRFGLLTLDLGLAAEKATIEGYDPETKYFVGSYIGVKDEKAHSFVGLINDDGKIEIVRYLDETSLFLHDRTFWANGSIFCNPSPYCSAFGDFYGFLKEGKYSSIPSQKGDVAQSVQGAHENVFAGSAATNASKERPVCGVDGVDNAPSIFGFMTKLDPVTNLCWGNGRESKKESQDSEIISIDPRTGEITNIKGPSGLPAQGTVLSVFDGIVIYSQGDELCSESIDRSSCPNERSANLYIFQPGRGESLPLQEFLKTLDVEYKSSSFAYLIGDTSKETAALLFGDDLNIVEGPLATFLGAPSTTVPDLVGLSQEAASAALEADKLVLGNITITTSSTASVGAVISQNPAFGTRTNSGSMVDLVISSGPLLVNVPYVIGLQQAVAITGLQGAGFIIGSVPTTPSGAVAAGQVISQTPQAGILANFGSSVNLLVSSGPVISAVPALVGKTKSSAVAALQSLSLIPGSITKKPSSAITAGLVFDQTPVSGSNLPVGSAVNLIVSSGKPVSVGLVRSGYFLWDSAESSEPLYKLPDQEFSTAGRPGDIPITGDWNGDGVQKIGYYRSSNGLFVLDWNGDGQFTAADKLWNLGIAAMPTDVPVVGDWNGDGTTKIGLFRKGFFWILDTNGDGVFDQNIDEAYAFGGIEGDVPIVGDWNGIGKSCVGLFRMGFYWLLDSNCNGRWDPDANMAGSDVAFPFGGISGDVPVVGDWNGDGTTKVGVFRSGFFWLLDANGNQVYDGIGAGNDLAFPFGGLGGDKPAVGKW